jgi:hypothetical protein
MQLSRADSVRASGYGLVAGVAALVLIGVPTDLIANPWFGREVPPRPLDYLFLALTTLLVAALGATYALPLACPTRERQLTAGGVLSFFAVGCPVCNKIVVLALGWGGAMTYFAPVQPLLGVVSLGVLGWAVWARARYLVVSPAPALAENGNGEGARGTGAQRAGEGV